MTAREVLNSALKLLGYTEANGNSELPQRILNRGTALINTIYSELHRAEKGTDFIPCENLTDEIKLSNTVLNEVMPSGVAMLIAQSESDGDSQSLWAEIYSRKKAILTRLEERVDSLPTVEE